MKSPIARPQSSLREFASLSGRGHLKVWALLMLGWCMAPAQQFKIPQSPRGTPIHLLTFTAVRHGLFPSRLQVKSGVYEIRFRNGETVQDMNFDVSTKGNAADPHDTSTVSHARSVYAYGLYRFTPGSYVISVRELPQLQAILEVQP